MKLPKSLLNSILIGVTTGTIAACSLVDDIVDSPIDVIKQGINCEIDGNCPYYCAACGMG